MTTRILGAVLGLLLAVGSASAQMQTFRLSAAEATARAAVSSGDSTASITVSETYSGTLTFEVIGEPGTPAVGVDCATFITPGTAVNSTTSTGVWVCPVAGASAIQARMSAYTSGTAKVSIILAQAPGQTVAAAGGGGSFDGVLLDAAGGDPLTDTVNNALKVNVVAGGGSGGTAMVDDAAFTPATTSITPAGAMFDDVAPDSVNEGDGGVVRMSANRNLYSTIRDAAGNERGANVTAGGALLVDASATTQPVSGTVTANAGTNLNTSALLTTTAHDAAFGTAGTADTQVRTIQGIASMTPVQVSQATAANLNATMVGTLAANGAAAATNRIGTLPAVVQNSAPSLTDGRDAGLSLTTGGAIRAMITNAAGAASTLASDGTFGSTLPSTGPAVGLRAETTTPSAVTDGQQVAPFADTLGRLQVLPGASDLPAGAASGCALVSAASTNATNCKNAPGNFYGFRIVNTTATLYYLRMYNLAASPTCSSATGFVESIPIPASTTGAGIVAVSLLPEAYTTGISYCFTGGSSSTDNTNAATGVFGRLFYK